MNTKIHFGLKNFFDSLRFKWTKNGEFLQRTYNNYENYRKHQKSKREYLDLSRHDAKFKSFLSQRLSNLDFIKPGMSVLCLGARSGAEVEVFKAKGCFAVGMDLNPTPENHHVLYGDFHHIEFPDESVDIIYTNSLDHSLLPDKFALEVKRVLRYNGHLILEIVEDKRGAYEVLEWKNNDEIIKLFPLKLINREQAIFWGKKHPKGEYLIFRK